MTIAVDFDGTIVEDRYPEIGREKPFATQTLRMLIEERHKLILWSVRRNEELKEAVEWCKERGVEFYAVNLDFPEEKAEYNEQYSRKIKADMFIDDRNLGGMLDWGTIYQIIKKHKKLIDMLDDADNSSAEGSHHHHHHTHRKKHWWQF